jgi:Domain of unknown function (DUF1848)
MIISASYKTDIPTFYGEWFMNRLEAGYCKMVNPYNQHISSIDLSPEKVDGFVFWTKNIGPFLKYLPEVQKRGYPFIVQHTINGYPPQLEFRVIDYLSATENMKRLSGEYGPGVAIWRYDPIIVSSLTPLDWHRHNFERLTTVLEGTTDEVVVSFAQIYKKTKRNMDWAAKEFGFTWDEHKAVTDERIRDFIAELALISQSHAMQLRVCSQKALLSPGIVEEARCVDADRIEKLAHRPIHNKSKQRGNRKECGCFASKDIGEYDTCPHGCIYCYAVQNRDLALQRYKSHNPKSEFLFSPKDHISSKDEEICLPHIIPITKIGRNSGASKIVQKKLFE